MNGAGSESPRGTALGSLTWPELVTAHLALVVGVMHVSLGVLNWVKWLSAGFLVPRDVRWPLFVLSGALLLAGLFIALVRAPSRRLYVGGIVLSVGYVVGYFGWHVGGHRPLLVVGPGTGHSGPLVSELLAHLFAGPVEFLAIVTELALAVMLALLLLTDVGAR